MDPYKFQAFEKFLVTSHEITFPKNSSILVTLISGPETKVVYEAPLRMPISLRIKGDYYELGIMTPDCCFFENVVNWLAAPDRILVKKIDDDPCFIGVTNTGIDTVTFQYALPACPVTLRKVKDKIYIVSPCYDGAPSEGYSKTVVPNWE